MGNRSRFETADVSESGCYVHMSITLELGARVSIVLWLGDEKVCGTGRVVTRHPQFGNGIELELAQEGRDRLRQFLQEPS
jgi:PilZ domain-containing protein